VPFKSAFASRDDDKRTTLTIYPTNQRGVFVAEQLNQPKP
jgi:hypothetical protein